jgi:hypothetical protein
VSKSITIKLDFDTAKDVYECLVQSQLNHSIEFPSERIVRIRSVMNTISEKINQD